MRICSSIVVVILLVQTAVAQDPPKPIPAPLASPVNSKQGPTKKSPRSTVTYRIKNVEAQKLAEAVNQVLRFMVKKELKRDGFIVDSPVVIIPEPTSNSLIVCATQEYQKKVAEIIRDVDERPTMVMIQVLVEEIENGKATVLSRPQVMTVDGTEAFVEFGSEEKKLRIRFTPHVVQEDEEVATSPKGAIVKCWVLGDSS